MAWLLRLVLLVVLAGGTAPVLATTDSNVTLLRAKHAALIEQLRHNQFQRPIYMESAEASNALKGEVYALLDYPFVSVSGSLSGARQWCDVLILHLNIKYCRADAGQAGPVLKVNVGKKEAQPLDDAYPIEFSYRLAAATPNYLEVQLSAEEGPLSTSDYRIHLEAIPVEGGQTFLHLTYSYAYGLAGRLAMKTYLATLASDKVGFTVTGRQPDGRPDYIGGVRGVVERNTMRYYLAIDAYLGAMAAPPAQQLERRLQGWFMATEQYPRQLREVSRTAYLDMKRGEYRRQQSAQ